MMRDIISIVLIIYIMAYNTVIVGCLHIISKSVSFRIGPIIYDISYVRILYAGVWITWDCLCSTLHLHCYISDAHIIYMLNNINTAIVVNDNTWHCNNIGNISWNIYDNIAHHRHMNNDNNNIDTWHITVRTHMFSPQV